MIDIRAVFSNYFEHILVGAWLVTAFPVDPYIMFYNLTLAFWWIWVFCLVHEVNHRRQEIKNAPTNIFLTIAPKKKWWHSVTFKAYAIAITAVILFFIWLGVWA